MLGLKFPEEYRDGLERVLAAAHEYGPEIFRSGEKTILVAKNVQSFLAQNGVAVTLGQAEQVWALYSHDKCASWLMGGDTVAEARLAVIELCQSVQEGENHVGL